MTRKRKGRVRECHGDLHLENMMLLDDEIVPFDCLEFNERLRWIDVMSDLAFAVMDLAHRGRADFAHRLLDRYLAASGDYCGLQVLPLYLVYRALVRAKVACIRAGQQADDRRREGGRLEGERDQFIDRGRAIHTASRPPLLIITHGLSGSGKSTISAELVDELGAIRLRSDVERKRLFGIEPTSRPTAHQRAEVYSQAATRRTYDRLLELARGILNTGYPVVRRCHVSGLRSGAAQEQLAAELGVAFGILDVQASPAKLRERIEQRLAAGSDVSDADLKVLEQQLADREPLSGGDRAAADNRN